MTVNAIEPSDLTTIGVVATLVLVIGGVLLGLLVTALIGRVLIAIVVIVLGVLVWQQRARIEDKVSKDKCALSTTFFGIHVSAPRDVTQKCRATLNR